MTLHLEVGKIYKSRVGDFQLITDLIPEQSNRYALGARFKSQYNWLYTENGKFVDPANNGHDYYSLDLIELSSEEEARKQDIHRFAPEIGLDDIVIRGKDVPDYLFLSNPHMNPHSERELGLMRAGLKPYTKLGIYDWDDYWKESCKKYGWFFRINQVEMDGKLVDRSVEITLKGEAWRIDAMQYTMFSPKINMPVVSRHEIFGRLLGYREEDIRYWLARGKLSQRLRRERNAVEVVK